LWFEASQANSSRYPISKKPNIKKGRWSGSSDRVAGKYQALSQTPVLPERGRERERRKEGRKKDKGRRERKKEGGGEIEMREKKMKREKRKERPVDY
jgi:hypothetical protein